MPTFDVAHIHEQGQDIIIIFVAPQFGSMPQSEQQSTAVALQSCATSAGLAGTVVPVWDAGGGRMGFFAPRQWHAYFSSRTLDFVLTNINKTLTCA